MVEDLVVGLSLPSYIELDVAAGKMYWIDAGTGKIQRANLDGSVVEDLVTGLTTPHGIALHVAAGMMYWTDRGTGQIERSNLDGSGAEVLVTGLTDVREIALYVTDAADPPTSTITAAPSSITADGVSTSTITVQLKDSSEQTS